MSSVVMEKEAYTRCMLDILNIMDLCIHVASTGRHVLIKRLMKTGESLPHILHQFDPWHVKKSVLNKVMKSSQNKSYKFFHITT